MLTLLFNVLVSASPKELAGDVGALRGVVNNVSSALGAAFSSVVAVGLLSFFIISAFNLSDLPPILRYEINFDKIDFVSNDQLKTVLSQTSATPAEVDVAVLINAAARLAALVAATTLIAGCGAQYTIADRSKLAASRGSQIAAIASYHSVCTT